MTEEVKKPSVLDLVSADFARDKAKENKGVWLPYGRLEYLIARGHRSNAKFSTDMEVTMRPYQWAIRRGEKAIESVASAINEALHDTYSRNVVFGVRRSDTKEELPITPDEIKQLFKDLPDFWDWVYKEASNDLNYSSEQVAADSKNSSSASSGS